MKRVLFAIALSCWFASTAAAADDAHGGGFADMLWPAVNLIILLAAIAYFAGKPIQAYFAKRRSDIDGDIQGAAGQLSEAESTYAEWQRRLASLEGELEEIRAGSRQRAEAEGARIVSEAQAAADRIRRDAASAVDQELRRARVELREEATQLAIEIAGERLAREVTDDDRDRLLDEFIERVESSADAPGVS